MARLKLLLHPDDPTSFMNYWVREVMHSHQYVDLVEWQPNTKYDRNNHVLVINCMRYWPNQQISRMQPDWFRPDWFRPYLNDGYKIVIDNLWDPHQLKNYQHLFNEHCFVLENQKWFWLHESLTLRPRDRCKNYQPNRTYQNLALLPLLMSRPHRDQLLIHLSEILDQIIWSYVEHGRRLPNDPDIVQDRHFNPEWYDNTYFSIVSETLVNVINPPDRHLPFVTEKTFKPIAYRHPFVVAAQPGHLQYIRNLGFETFDNLFDEGYDSIADWSLRLTSIINTIKQFKKQPYDKLTLHKIEHNYNRFFNKSLVDSQFINEILFPIINYAESK